MTHRLVRLTALVILVCALSLQTDSADAPFADPIPAAAPKIRPTPFDRTLSRAGFFASAESAEPRPRSPRSIQDLFQVARSFRYTHDAREREWQTEQETASKRSGDCADKAVWLYAQLKKNGYEDIRLVIGKYRASDPIFHAWVTYTDGAGDTYALDPTLQRRPWKIQRLPEGFYKPIYSYGGNNVRRY